MKGQPMITRLASVTKQSKLLYFVALLVLITAHTVPAEENSIDIKEFPDLSAAVLSPRTANKTIVISNTQNISSLTIPSNRVLRFANGGLINVKPGNRLVMQGKLISGRRQIFSKESSVFFEKGMSSVSYPEWWGARGDGIADDYLPIQKAIASQGTVKLSPKTYTIGQNIIIPSDCNIYGTSSVSSILKKSFNATHGAFISAEGVSNVTIKNISIDMQKHIFNGPHTALYFNYKNAGNNVKLINITVNGSTSGGLVVDNTDKVLIDKCNISDTSAGDGIRVAKSSNAVVSNCTINNMIHLQRNRRGIQVGGSRNIGIMNNNVRDAINSYALDVGGSINGKIVDNTITKCASGIDLENGSANISIVNNRFSGVAANKSGYIGIHFINGGCSDIRVEKNELKDFYQAIRVEGSKNIDILENYIRDSQSASIVVVNSIKPVVSSDRILIKNNTIINSSAYKRGAAPAVSIDASNTVMSDNFISGSQHSYAVVYNSLKQNVTIENNNIAVGSNNKIFDSNSLKRQ